MIVIHMGTEDIRITQKDHLFGYLIDAISAGVVMKHQIANLARASGAMKPNTKNGPRNMTTVMDVDSAISEMNVISPMLILSSFTPEISMFRSVHVKGLSSEPKAPNPNEHPCRVS